ncbi:hypothetical protein THAOC_07096 [Thalassiosira oceanica]|uniref:Uncharacterized protein n=1 Tax=Thalassiosira oceanica TaxID=159749 RepID=K0TD87_THAOC|nr:hypothetical protein THAOC_07096 [Thalassiosira oceanica]|eukprot:EJK71461.1 hypothetical protein THAOC_07096 [Thalassiosira oceanica]
MAPYRSRTDEKMVPSHCLAVLSLPPGQLAPQVSPRPAITQTFGRHAGRSASAAAPAGGPCNAELCDACCILITYLPPTSTLTMQVQEFKWSWRTFSINISLPDADVVAHGREGDRRDIIGTSPVQSMQCIAVWAARAAMCFGAADNTPTSVNATTSV